MHLVLTSNPCVVSYATYIDELLYYRLWILNKIVLRIATVQVTSHMCGSTYVPASVKLKKLVFSYRFLYTGFVRTLVKVHTCVTHQRCSMCICM